MKNVKSICPCCNNEITIKFDQDTGEIFGVFFDIKPLSEKEAFEYHGICLGVKGGEQKNE